MLDKVCCLISMLSRSTGSKEGKALERRILQLRDSKLYRDVINIDRIRRQTVCFSAVERDVFVRVAASRRKKESPTPRD